MKPRVGSAGTLRYFVICYLIFAVYYVISNFGAITTDPRFAGPMFGSMAQFTLPYACAAGTYLALSSEALGLFAHERLAARSAFPRYVLEVLFFLTAVSVLTLVLAAAVDLTQLAKGIDPQVSMQYAFYPIAFGIAGASVGVLFGRLILQWGRPRRLSIVLMGSLAVGFNLFLIGIFQDRIFGHEKLSMVVGSRITDPGFRVSPSLLWTHVCAMSIAGLLILGSVTVVLALGKSRRLLAIVVGATALALLSAGTLYVASVVDRTPLTVARPRSEVRCQQDKGVRLCYWEDERDGAALLRTALSHAQSKLEFVQVPSRISQKGIGDDQGDTIRIVSMPASRRTANYYVAEFVVDAAGCRPQSREEANRLLKVKAYIASLLSAERVEFRSDRLKPLEQC